MKLIQVVLSTTLLIIAFGCTKDKSIGDTEILGEWKLIEEKIGSGMIPNQPVEFEAVQSNKTIVFLNDGSYQSNGEICQMSSESNSQSSGLFYEALGSIEPEGCQNASPTSGITYQVDGKYLIIAYQCFEECQQKYERL